MTEVLFSIGGFLLALGILVTVHEYGHFWVARTLGIKVLRFSVGFGKPLWLRRAGPDQTEYVVAAIPLGGYVKMLDETEEEVADHEVHRAFNRQPIWKRTAVVLAGPFFNFLFAFAAYMAVAFIGVEDLRPVVRSVQAQSLAAQSGLRRGDEILSVNGRAVNGWGEQRLYLFNQAFRGSVLPLEVRGDDGVERDLELDLSQLPLNRIDAGLIENGIGISPLPPPRTKVGLVLEDSAAAAAGLRAGDRITAVNGEKVELFSDLVEQVAPNAGKVLTLTVERDGAELEIPVTPRPQERGDRTIGVIGVAPAGELPQDAFTTLRYGPVDATLRSVESVWLMSIVTIKMLVKIVQLEISARNISGPLTIAQYAGKTVQVGLDRFLLFLAVVSVSLGVINLLPIPILDGGHLLYYAAEAVTGAPVSKQVLLWGQQIGILMLFGLMSLAFYNDILRLLQ